MNSGLIVVDAILNEFFFGALLEASGHHMVDKIASVFFFLPFSNLIVAVNFCQVEQDFLLCLAHLYHLLNEFFLRY